MKYLNIFRDKKFQIISFFILLTLIFYGKTIFSNQVLLPGDILSGWYPWKHEAKPIPHNELISDAINYFYPVNSNLNYHLKKGELILWYPYNFLGYPIYANGISKVFYPLRLILNYLFSPLNAHSLFLILHTFFMGIFMYLYLRSLNFNHFGSLLSGIVWMFNGYIMVWLESEFLLISGSLLPLVLLFYKKAIDRQNIIYVFYSGIFLGLAYLGSHLNIFLYVIFMLFLYFLYFLVINNNRRVLIIYFLILLVISFAISALQLFPDIQYFLLSYKLSYTYAELKKFPLSLIYLISYILPNFWGSPANDPSVYKLFSIKYLHSQNSLGSNFNEICGYVGIIPLFLASIALYKKRSSLNIFLGLISISSVLIAFRTPIFYFFHCLIPGLNTIGPERIIFLYAFCLSILAGSGFDYLIDLNKNQIRKIFLFFSIVITLLIITAIFYSLGLYLIGTDVFSNKSIITKHFSIFFNPTLYIPLFTGALFFIFGNLWIKNRIQENIFKITTLILVAVELMSFGIGYNTLVAKDKIYPQTGSVKMLTNDNEFFRVMINNHADMSPNTFSVFRIPEIGGYESFLPKRYFDFFKNINNDPNFNNTSFEAFLGFINMPRNIQRLLGIKYMLSPPDTPPLDGDYNVIYNQDLTIYQDANYIPKCFIAHQYKVIKEGKEIFRELLSPDFNPRSTVILEEESFPNISEYSKSTNQDLVVIDKYSPNEIQINSRSDRDGFLILLDSYYSGWKAYVDEKETKIYQADYLFRAIRIEKGSHKIEYIFRPVLLKIGLVLSLLSLNFISIIIILSLIKNKVGRNNSSC